MFLTARRLFGGRSDIVRHVWGVEVRAGRIADVRPRTASDRDVVDLGDATLLPGLVDVHQHLVFDASNDPVGHLAALDDDTPAADGGGDATRSRCRDHDHYCVCPYCPDEPRSHRAEHAVPR